MEEKLRKSGIDIIEDVPWGTHFCQFFQTENDLLDVLVPYFKVGLESNEFCMWVTSKPLNVKKAQEAMRKGFSDFDYYLKKGQIEIIPHSEWYLQEGVFKPQMVLTGWIGKHNQALANGYDGMRVTGNTAWLETSDWRSFVHYEEEINNVIRQYRLIALCTYSLDKCGLYEILEVARNHQFAFIRREGIWQIIESYESKQAREALRKSEREKALILDNMSEMVLFQDAEQRILLANKAAHEAFGLPPGQIIGRRCYEVLTLNKPCPVCLAEKTLKTAQPQEGEIATRDGRDWLVRCAPVRNESGEIIGSITVAMEVTQRKRAEEALRKSSEILRVLIDTNPESILLIDTKGTIITANVTAAQRLGKSPEDLAGSCLYDLFTPELNRQRRTRVNEVIATGKSTRFVHMDGGRHYNTYLHPVQNEAGEVISIAILAVDINEHKQAEEALRTTRDYLEKLFNYANAPIVVWDQNFKITRFNRAFEHLTGYSADKVIGQKLGVLFPKESQEETFLKITKTLRGEYLESVEIPILCNNGDIRIVLWNSANIYADDGQTLCATIAQGHDISARKQAEEAFKNLVFRAPIGIYIIQGGRFKLINPGFQEITGYKEEEIPFIKPLELVHLDDREEVRKNAAKMLKGISLTPYEYRFITKGGQTRWILEKVTPTIYEGGKATLGYFMDITEHKLLESQFLQAQKMEAVGRLAGGVAHDFNNILMGILGLGELMKLELRKDDPLYHYAEDIVKVAERGSSLTRQLLAFSRRQILQPRVIGLNLVIADLETMLRRLIGEDIELVLVLDPALGAVRADPGQIEQVIMNLAVNARDAMPHGGKLSLETANVYLDESYVQRHVEVPPGSYVMLALSDNGCGMDAETQAHVFEPFFTTKEAGKGTGLGLPTVYGIMKQSGGHIEVFSEPGAGTTLKIYLPQVEEVVEGFETKVGPAELLHGSETILVVEDEDTVRGLICEFVGKYGYQVLEARHGGEALLICERHQGPIHLLLTDVIMPQMDGRELAERLTPLHPEMKVLYMSGYTDKAVIEKGILDKGLFFLMKPFKPLELAQKIREMLKSS
jgi:two-component system cell cycle sensor histidine kinase/response regulator CckA